MSSLFAFSKRGAAKVQDKIAELSEEEERKVFVPSESKLLVMPNVHNLKTELEVAEAFVESEEVYYSQGLSVLMKDFLKRIEASSDFNKSKKLLESQEISQFYRNFVGIYEMNHKLNTELQELRKSGSLLEGLPKVMNKMIPFFKVYTSYIIEYKQVAKFFSKKRDSDTKFFDFLYMNEVASNSSFDTLLSAPVSRLPQYLVFLGGVLEKSESGDSNVHELAKAVQSIKAVTDDIALKMRDRSKRDQVVTVQQKYFSDSANLLNPSRYVVKVGPLKQVEKSMISKHKNTLNLYAVVLFNDMLLYGVKANKIRSGKVVSVMRLKGMSVIDIPDSSAEMYKNSFVITTPFLSKKPLVVCAPTLTEKENWIKVIRATVEENKNSEATALAGQQGALDDENFERMIKKLPFVNSSTAVNSSLSKTMQQNQSVANQPEFKQQSGQYPPAHSPPTSPSGGGENRTVSPGKGPPPRPPSHQHQTLSHPVTTDESGGGGLDGGDVPSAPPMSYRDAAPEAPPISDEEFNAGGGGGGGYHGGDGRPTNATAASTKSHATAGGGDHTDLLDSIRKGGALKPAAQRQVSQLPKQEEKPVGLQAALKSSLEQYRKFVQDEEPELHSDDEQDWE